jgi:3-isopropylmalate/(R)-2-methylmalate dehydratase small subunit
VQKFTVHTGKAVPLRHSNVDTDQIIPAEYLKRITRNGYEDALFAEWRADPSFVLNRDHHAGASILIAGPEFGTGSSREHAVWALSDYGFRVVLSARFADIFRGNSGKNGLLTAVLEHEHVEKLWSIVEDDPHAQITVDLEECTVSVLDLVVPFEVDGHTRWRLLEGLDDVGTTLTHGDLIDAFEGSRPAFTPVTQTR